jgi:ATP-dependent Clp protease ATP-binding subunit ClpC
MPKLKDITNLDQLQALLDNQNSGQSRQINVDEMTAALNDRVKGQEHVTADVARVIKLQWAKEKRKRPIANLPFVGKTGTGKTELAKAMAEYLYKDEKAMLRYDCSELKSPESIVRLVGAPVSYVGAEKGGELTRAVINNPKRLILFDEIEKAYTEVLDLFLQMMGDGRLTEQGSGKTADFTQSIIVLTSNLAADAITKLQEEMTDPHELVNAVKGELVASGKFRPEIAGRIDKVFVFKPLQGIVVAEIIVQKMYNAAKSYGLELVFIDAHLIMRAMEAGNKLKEFGIRELENAIGDMLGESLIAAKEEGAKRVRLEVEEDGEMAISIVD